MSDLIDRKEAIEKAERIIGECAGYKAFAIVEALRKMPSAEPTIIRCADCKWWDRLEDGHPYGYCRACRSGTHTERWEISIYRQNRYDFYCADAEPKENEDDDE